MLRLDDIDLDKNPSLIQPPKVDDGIVFIKLVSDENEIITSDIIDVALSYSIAGIDVVLEIPFETKNEFNTEQLASLVCNGAWSLSLLPPADGHSKKLIDEYCKEIIEWYRLWRGATMRNFEKTIYPITPFAEYLATTYLIDKNKEELTDKDAQSLMLLSQNPDDVYLVGFIDNMNTSFVDAFKAQLQHYIQHNDDDFCKDIDLLTNANAI